MNEVAFPGETGRDVPENSPADSQSKPEYFSRKLGTFWGESAVFPFYRRDDAENWLIVKKKKNGGGVKQAMNYFCTRKEKSKIIFVTLLPDDRLFFKSKHRELKNDTTTRNK